MAPSNSLEPCSLTQLLAYFLRLGTFGFGGPIALAGRMDRDLVEERALFPAAFIAPSFLMAVAVAAAYTRFEHLPWIQDVFYGVGAAVIAIIAQSAYRLSRKTIDKDVFLWLLFAAVAVTTVWTGSEIVWLFVICGVVAVVVKHPPRALVNASVRTAIGFGWTSTGLHGVASGGVVGTLTLFFLKAGAFVFGSGLAIVPFLYGGVISQYHWLTERQFVDAIAVAMIAPGPVVITAAFIGYRCGGAGRRSRGGCRSLCSAIPDRHPGTPFLSRLGDNSNRRGSAYRAIKAQKGSGTGIDCTGRNHRPPGSSLGFLIGKATVLEEI